MMLHGIKPIIGALAYRSTNLNNYLPYGVQTGILMNAAAFDSNSFWNASANPERLTVPTGLDGMYYITGGLETTANVLNFHLGWLVHIGRDGIKRGGTVVSENSTNTVWSMATTYGPIPMSGGDFVVLEGYQTSNFGTAQTVISNTTYLGLFKI